MRMFLSVYGSVRESKSKGGGVQFAVTELECLAIVWALKKWHEMLLGRHIRVHTDHKALSFLQTCVYNNTRIVRWFSFLQEFELDIQHVASKICKRMPYHDH